VILKKIKNGHPSPFKNPGYAPGQDYVRIAQDCIRIMRIIQDYTPDYTGLQKDDTRLPLKNLTKSNGQTAKKAQFLIN